MKKINYNSGYEYILRDGVIGCKGLSVKILPPYEEDVEKCWTLFVKQEGALDGVVVAWYRTRELARVHARKIRHTLKDFSF